MNLKEQLFQMRKILNSNLVNRIVKCISILMFSAIFLVLIVIDTKVQYNYKNEIKPDNYKCLLAILFVALLASIIAIIIKKIVGTRIEKVKKVFDLIEKKSTWIIAILFILLFIVQIIILQNIYFETGWDLEHIFKAINQYVETGILEDKTYFAEYPYFSVYPNNLFLVTIFAVIGRIVVHFQYHGVYKALVLLDIILVDLAGIVMVKTIENFTNRKNLKILGTLIFIAFIGLSPWFLVPYSDTYSILFPISVLYCYTKKDKKWYHYLLIGLCSYIGYLIKPTSIIILIAIILIECYKTIFKIKDKTKMKFVAKNGATIVLGIAIALILKMGVINIINYESEKEYTISFYHYLMMGINQDSTGAFSHEDIIASLSIRNYDERVEYNKKTFVERLKSLSFKDFCKFYTKKTLVNYNDGTLAWGREGDFYSTVNDKENKLANLLKDFYYNDGSLYYVFSDIMQVIWIGILLFVMLGAILKEFDYNTTVAYLALIGLTIFTLLFEARARYLYLYAPYYIILAVIGIETIYKKYQTIKDNKK